MMAMVSDPALAAALVLVAVLATALLTSTIAERRRRGLRQRLETIIGQMAAGGVPADPEMTLTLAPANTNGHGIHLLPAGLRAWLDGALAATGDSVKLVHLFLAAAAAGALAFVFSTGVLHLGLQFAGPIAFVAASLAPWMLLRRAQFGFQRKFLDAFPDALDLIVRAVKAGLPILEAMAAAGKETAEPVGKEFRRVIDEMRIGVEMEEVLQRAADRIRINDFRFFVVCLALQKRTGGSLAETLGNLSGVIRRRKDLRLKARALTAEAKASASVLGALPIVAGGSISAYMPEYMGILVTDHRGNIILGIAFLSISLGFWVMSTMIKRSLR